MSDLADIMKNAQEAGDVIRQDRTLHELVARWRTRAKDKHRQGRVELGRAENEPHWDRAEAHYKVFEIFDARGGVWANAADELEQVLKERDDA